MSVTTTQLLSSGEFCKLRYDTIPVKSASANFFSILITQKCQILSCDTLVENEHYYSPHRRSYVQIMFVHGNFLGKFRVYLFLLRVSQVLTIVSPLIFISYAKGLYGEFSNLWASPLN